MSLSDSISLQIRFSQFIGLAPFSFSKLTHQWEPNRFHGYFTKVLLILFGVIILICIIFNENVVERDESEVLTISVNLQLFLDLTHILVIFIEMIRNQREHVKLLNLFEKFELLLKEYGHDIDYMAIKKLCKQLITFWAIEFIVIIILECTTQILRGESLRPLYLFIALLPYIPTVMYTILIGMYISLLRLNIIALNKHLANNEINRLFHESLLIEVMSFTKPKKKNVEMIHFLKKCYSTAWECGNVITEIISFTMPVAVLNSFFFLVVNSFFFVIALFADTKFSISANIITIAWISICLLNLMFVTVNCTKTIAQVC